MESPIQLDETGAEWLELEQLIAGCPKPTAIDVIGGIFCNICHSTFGNKKEFDRHYTEQHSNTPSGIVYTCVVCRKEIAPYPNFRNHCYQAHVVKDRFKCEHCNRQFSKQSILNSHIDAVHIFRCALCQKQFPSKNELHTHQNLHKREKEKPPYPCQQCSKTIESVDMCELHIDEHCKILYPCPICDETTASKIETAKHLTKHFDEVLTNEIDNTEISADCSVDMLGGVLCCYCDELFKNRTDFDLHFCNEHSNQEIVYSCNICGKQYHKYNLFANHCHFHVSKNRFECVECGKLFPRVSLLVLHTEAFHTGAGDSKPFSCVQCGHAFGSAWRLREHMRAAHTATSFTCPVDGCQMTFEAPRELILHQRKHQTSRDNWCRQCGLQFTTLSSCQAHLDVHRKKQYTCPVCNKEYREKYFIIKHIPTHFESVLHVCKVCGKVFNARSRLVEHTKTHSEIRNHKCSYCGKGFMRPHQLEQHLNIHTGSKPYKCMVCPKSFANHPNWMKHLKKIHNIDKNKLKTLAEDNKKANKNAPVVKNIITVDKNDSETKCESGIESTSPDLSLDNYIFESDDSTVDSIDPAIIEKDWCILNENAFIENSLQYTDMLPVVNNTTLEIEAKTSVEAISGVSAMSAASQGAVLREYGPEFNVDDGIHLDEPCLLPHIDPLLTIKAPGPPAWEPRVTRVYGDERLAVVDADVY
ncbi:uncharacterized protein LOC142976471 [Anticarsia gemmatalis]|uniref:uncharacterized protein LOC142976471 n=1 Tax=Anticarsia gemmatalis TaxID=129554 RepID=UPI003F7768D3